MQNEMSLYQQFIAKSRYARYLDDKKRRENWSETVARYFDFLEGHLHKKFGYDMSFLRPELEEAVYNLDVMPSMRALMAAGPAAERDNVSVFNCSYLPIDDVKSFDEAMYILLCGTGVGFSVERQYICKLPEVPEKMFDSKTTIVVRDSKEGWAKALRQLISLLYAGEVPKWDVSRVRPAGARLKTFGGRASGPEPLVELFEFVSAKFKAAAGRKLNTLECHDILCKIGEVVVVGGVRRSAMISLSNLSDDRMRAAKVGSWWEQHPQRALANNSACYTEKPEVGVFLDEWKSLYESKSGERGVFNREAAKMICDLNGRRDSNHEFGTNPCSEIILRPYQFCNLTEAVVRADDDAYAIKQKVRLATILGTFQATLTDFPYLRKVWKKNTEEENLLGVSLTGVYDNPLTSQPDPSFLRNMKEFAVAINAEVASEVGIAPSTAITCIKPSGTVSQLVDSASGIHPRHSPYYIRRVRQDIKDPLTTFMMEKGIPFEPCYLKPDSTVVFEFPQRSPNTGVVRDEVTAIDHLNNWLVYQQNWCEHKPSVTVSVKEDEWPAVGAFVWDNFDWMSGVSFLPHDGGSYKQAPYEECDEETYLKLLEAMPKHIDWDELIEEDDNVEGVQTLACSAGVCEF